LTTTRRLQIIVDALADAIDVRARATVSGDARKARAMR